MCLGYVIVLINCWSSVVASVVLPQFVQISTVFFFFTNQVVVNSKKIGGRALQGKQNGLKKDRSLLVFFEYSINHNNRTSV